MFVYKMDSSVMDMLRAHMKSVSSITAKGEIPISLFIRHHHISLSVILYVCSCFLSSNTVRLSSNNRHTPVILSSRFRRVMVKPSLNSGQIAFTLTCIWVLSSKTLQWYMTTGDKFDLD
jgi:hypothetical protein